MLRKKNRNMDEYKRAGAEMRLFKTLGSKLAGNISRVVSVSDYEIIRRALGKIAVVCSRAEDNMFHDYPELLNEYKDVFYGDVRAEPRNKVDEEIIGIAKKVCDEFFE